MRRQGVPHRINGPTLAFLLALVLVASGCGNFDVIRDIRELPQNHFAYLPWDNDGRLRVDKDWQEEMKERYLENHFLPWRGEAPRVTSDEVKAAWLPFVPDPDDGSRSARRSRSPRWPPTRDETDGRVRCRRRPQRLRRVTFAGSRDPGCAPARRAARRSG